MSTQEIQGAQPAPVPEYVRKKPHFYYDPECGILWFATEAEAMAYAAESLKCLSKDARHDGEWPSEVEDMRVGIVTHATVETGNDDDGYDYKVVPLAAAIPSPEGGPTVKESLTAAYGDKWQGAEEWMPLAWELCANECGEDACTELIWEGGPIPEPWGDRWLKYEDQAKEMIAMVRKHVRPQPDVQQAPAAQVQPIGVEAVARVYTNDDGEPAIEWLLEGGIHAASDGGESLLLVSHEPITNDEGYGEVYLAQPQPKGTDEALQIKEQSEAGWKEVKRLAAERDRLTVEVSALRGLAATCYAGLGAECDLPENWLDVLNAAANGELFTTDGLLPFTATQAPAPAPEPIGYLTRTRFAVEEAKKIGAPGEDLSYLWVYTHGTKDLERFERSLDLEVVRVYGAAQAPAVGAEEVTAVAKEARSFLRETRKIIKANNALRTQVNMRVWLDRESALSARIDAVLPKPPVQGKEGA